MFHKEYSKEQMHNVMLLRLQNKDVHQIAQHLNLPEHIVTKITIKLMAQGKIKPLADSIGWANIEVLKDFYKVKTQKPRFWNRKK